MTNSIQRLEESIADKIKNYQKHLNYWEFDDKHVDIWIKQFPEEEREIVLTEIDSLLSHNYIKKSKIKEFFEEIWDTKEIMGTNPIMSLNQIQFLNIQIKGHSQKRLVNLLEEYYLKSKGITINRCNHMNVKKYIYLDDCMYTGLTLMKDINNWIDNTLSENKREYNKRGTAAGSASFVIFVLFTTYLPRAADSTGGSRRPFSPAARRECRTPRFPLHPAQGYGRSP